MPCSMLENLTRENRQTHKHEIDSPFCQSGHQTDPPILTSTIQKQDLKRCWRLITRSLRTRFLQTLIHASNEIAPYAALVVIVTVQQDDELLCRRCTEAQQFLRFHIHATCRLVHAANSPSPFGIAAAPTPKTYF